MGVFRNIFGPSRDEIWRQFADQVGGSVTNDFWKGAKVEAAHEEWTVTLDSYTVSTGKSSTTYTRMRAPYVNPDNFRFAIYRKTMFSDIGKWFGMQDVEVGYPEFDADFIIKGNDVEKLKKLFSDDKLRDLISTQPSIRFGVQNAEKGYWGKKKYPLEVDELCFQVVGIIKDVERLKQLYVLFSETLDQLCRMGSAYKGKPTLSS